MGAEAQDVATLPVGAHLRRFRYGDECKEHGVQEHHALSHQDDALGLHVWQVGQQRLGVGLLQVPACQHLDVGVHADEVRLH